MTSRLAPPKDATLRVCVTTWNVGNAEPFVGPLIEALQQDASVGMAVFGLQEATYGRGGTTTISLLTSAMSACNWVKLQAVNLGEMRLCVYVRPELRARVSDVMCAIERTGLGNVVNNKGGISLRLTFDTTTLTFISAHLEAHQGQDHRMERNIDVAEILKGTQHFKTQHYDPANFAEHTFFMGDLNYRMVHDYTNETNKHTQVEWDNICSLIAARNWEPLRRMDELQHERLEHKVFVGYEEAPIVFEPTFKVERAVGVKYSTQRLPAWCDRILWRTLPHVANTVQPISYTSIPSAATSDHKPVQGIFDIHLRQPATLTAEPLPMRVALTDAVFIQFHSIRVSGMPKLDKFSENDAYLKFVSKRLFYSRVVLTTKPKINDAAPLWPESELPPLITRFANTADIEGDFFTVAVLEEDMAIDDVVGFVQFSINDILRAQRACVAPPYLAYSFKEDIIFKGLHRGVMEGSVSIFSQVGSV